MQHNVKHITGQLGELNALAHKTDKTERNILASANARLRSVQEELDKLSGHELDDDESAKRYQDLILERGKLSLVIQQSKERLPA
jgi:hypothetical protein